MLRALLFYLTMVFLSCLPGACAKPRHAQVTEPEDDPDTALAVRDTYPDFRPPRAP